MSFPRPNLDDRRFQDLVDEAKRMIPTFLPEWTNHNVSDPGVALIELFAWMTELTLYRLNRVPDRLYSSFLDLVGISPYSAEAATVPVSFIFSTVPEETVLIPIGTEVSTLGDDPVIFSTLNDLEVVQPIRAFVWTAPSNGANQPDEGKLKDVLEDLILDNAAVTVFPSDPVSPGDSLYIGFRESIGGCMLRLDIEADIEGIGVNPSRPPIIWEVWTSEGWTPCVVQSDLTGGLNRDGQINLAVPTGHLPHTVLTERAFWLRLRLLTPDMDGSGYRSSPKIKSLEIHAVGGTTLMEHSEIYGSEYLGGSDGKPAQSFAIQAFPILPRRTHEFVEVRHGEEIETWIEVSDFARSTESDKHFMWDSGSGVVHFGPRIRQDNGAWIQHGSTPQAGSAIWVTGYRRGGGARGNVGAGSLSVLRSAVPYVDQVTNGVGATGGIDPESLENAKMRAPLTLVSAGRAVTVSDHERLAKAATSRVSRALCVPPTQSGLPTRLLIVPDPGLPAGAIELDNLALDDSLFDTLTAYLEPRRLIGTSLELGTPKYVGVSVAAMIRVSPGRASGAIQHKCINAISEFLSPISGGPDGTGWPFGVDLTSGSISNILGAIDGIEQVEEVVLFESDLRNGNRLGNGSETIRFEQFGLPLSFRPKVVLR